MPSKAYDILKWIVLVFLPALTTLVGVVGQVLNLASMEIVLTIMVAVTTFLGTLLGVSNAQYKASKTEESKQ
ncbi:MAG: holin [Clostridia bacterium]|nr:holin [Clostridia bacterium]